MSVAMALAAKLHAPVRADVFHHVDRARNHRIEDHSVGPIEARGEEPGAELGVRNRREGDDDGRGDREREGESGDQDE